MKTTTFRNILLPMLLVWALVLSGCQSEKGIDLLSVDIDNYRPVDEFVEAYLSCKLTESLSLNYFATSVRQEAFPLTREVMIDNLAYDSTQDGIAKELEALVVQAVPFFVLGEHRLVHQRFLIDADVARIEAQHFMKNAIKLLILAERQPYRVYQV